MACPISWSPSLLAPVFFGHRDVSTSDGAPSAVRIFYPSLDGAPEDAPFLADCGRCPLVLFLHGQCSNEPDHFLRWFEFPAVLARCGYVVAVPDFGGLTDPFQDFHLEQVQTVISWMRDQWEHRDQLGEDTGAAGHSFGGVLAGRVAATGVASAYVSLSGAWISVISQLDILNALGAPALFMWGTDENPVAVGGDLEAQLDGEQIFQWNKVQPPKHRVRFSGGRHFDYLRPGQSACVSSGPCSLVGSVAADVAALFFSRYMPPPDAGIPKKSIEVSLTPPPLSLTPEQEFFVGGHLGGLKGLPGHPGCNVTLDEGPTTISVVQPSSIDFHSVPINSVRLKTFTIGSLGEAPVPVSIPPPPTAAVFTWEAFSGELGPGQTREIQVRFRPTSTASVQATIPVTAAGTPRPVALRGRGAGGFPTPET